jgi:hypothetical protein
MDVLLRGSWAFHRRLLHASGDALEVRGRATWTPLAAAAATLIYDEHGRMTRGGAFVADVRQRHSWRLCGAGEGAADVHFEDGRFFHSVALARPPPGAAARSSCAIAHDCAPDRYEGEWAVVASAAEGGDPSLECEWRVSGPAKSYRSSTRYWREEPAVLDRAAASVASGAPECAVEGAAAAAAAAAASVSTAHGAAQESRPP